MPEKLSEPASGSADEFALQILCRWRVQSPAGQKPRIRNGRKSRFSPLPGCRDYFSPGFGFAGIISPRSCGNTIVIGRESVTFSFGAG